MLVIQVDAIHSPGFVVPGYVKEDTEESVTLGDIGKCRIVVPIAMLIEHDESNVSRVTPTKEKEAVGRSKAAPVCPPTRRRPTVISGVQCLMTLIMPLSFQDGRLTICHY